MDISETELAWVAGFLDADGSISIRKQERGTVSPRYFIVVQASNRDKIALERLANCFGGKVFRVKQSIDRAHYSDCYHWHIASQKAARCLRETMPYLLIKRDQAINALKLQECIDQGNKGYGQQALSQWEVQQREKLYQIIRNLNQKGKPHHRAQQEARLRMEEKPLFIQLNFL